MSTAHPELIEGPTTQPLPYGLFTVVALRTETDPPTEDDPDRWQGGVIFETRTLAPAGGIGAAACEPGQTLGLPLDLDPNGGGTGEASPFTVYGHHRCSPVGTSVADVQAKADAHLARGEEARVEQALWTGDLGNVPRLEDPTTDDLTGGGAAVGPAVGIAVLEQYLASTYGAVGVIHMSRRMASALLSADVIAARSGRLTTALGTPVVAGTGYPGTGPAGQPVADGQEWVYATPAIFGYRSEVFTSSDQPGDLFDHGQNDLYAVAERTYLLGWEPSGVGAVLIDPAHEEGSP